LLFIRTACTECHGEAAKPKGGLDLRSVASILKGAAVFTKIAVAACLGGFAIAAFIFILSYCGVFPCCRRQKQLNLDVFPGLNDPAKQTSENRDQEY
jgi:hypothetical protein